MPSIPLGSGDYKRLYGKIPRIRLVNMFLEQDPTNTVDGLVRLQRPGLSPYQYPTVGTGPIKTIFRQDGTIDGDYFIQSRSQLWRIMPNGPVLMGNLAGEDPSKICARDDDILIANGGVAHFCQGNSIGIVVMPDGQLVQSVASINNYFILTVRDSQRFYWIEPGSFVVDPLNFASAERTPDDIVDVEISSDEIWFLGGSGVEVWIPTGDADAPFNRASGRVYSHGCRSRDSVCMLDTMPVWVTNNSEVVIGRGAPIVISDSAITEEIRTSQQFNLQAWTYKLDQHQFYVLSCDNGSFVYDINSRKWSRFHSYGYENWRPRSGAQNDTQIICGDSQTNKLWLLDPEAQTDDGQYIVREMTGGVEFFGAPSRCDSVSLRLGAGWSPSPDFEPFFEICWSDDQGNTWCDWRQIGMGNQGRYEKEPVLRKAGMMRVPGRLFWFRMTDPAMLRVNYARYNEAYR